MKICSLYGAGFYYIPGTDTCIKIGGFLRAEVNANAAGSFAQYTNINFDNRLANRYVARTRGAITVDARSQTEYGTLRSYMVLAMQIDNGTPNAPGGTSVGSASVGGSDVRTFSNAFFLQFAGFTAGSTASFFDFDTQAYSNQTNVLGSSLAGAGVPLIGYTAQLGNGLSATLSVEDEGGHRTYLLNSTVPGTAAAPATAYGGKRMPDFVGNVRIDQAWGSAQIMGAIHNVRAGYNLGPVAAIGTGEPSDRTGYAFGAGLKLNMPMLGKGDYIIAQANYARGATAYTFVGAPGGPGASNNPAFLIQNGSAPNVALGLTNAYGLATDGVYTGVAGTNPGIELTKSWSVTAGYEHNWNTSWKTSLYGAYGKVMYSDAASALIAATAPGVGAAALGVVPTGNAGFSFGQIGTRTVWTPVTNLDLSVDLMYNKLNTAFAGTAGFQDKSWFSGMFRAQRNFYP